ncbi:TESTIS-SPECIFIC Y-ENCODED PROTEIN [Salix purpurea]|uniref:TESTIS-SPECIFIC Y-ENCODED PROTEIN n=1 Tax=Salix purpurea TaxID=77065 RepID=A0A9Q0TAE6_SALPP|nr:TESTIS-SPECIFIC Y-ENCODED PROTEIN [Salix purpurea]
MSNYNMNVSLSPKVSKRVECLRHLQSQHDELEAQFLEERKALEAKYQKLFQPLYTKRCEIVNGLKEVDGVMSAELYSIEEDQATKEKGVPEFWLTAMKTQEVLAEEIKGQDEGALKFIKDIKWSRLQSPEAIGTEIEWYPGKCLTKKVVKKKPRMGSKKTKTITTLKICESFFTFFNPPHIPESVDELDDDAYDELQDRIEHDYDVGIIVRDKIIRHANIDADDNGDDDDENQKNINADDNESNKEVEQEKKRKQGVKKDNSEHHEEDKERKRCLKKDDEDEKNNDADDEDDNNDKEVEQEEKREGVKKHINKDHDDSYDEERKWILKKDVNDDDDEKKNDSIDNDNGFWVRYQPLRFRL